MNIDNNSDPNESLEAPEDDDFGDFEAAEDEAPEAVQAMIGGPNWVYPDLVRIQSSSNSSAQNDANPGLNNSCNRIMHRVLDPPDVSLLTSNANYWKPPTNRLDLCSSLSSSNNLSLLNTLMNHTSVRNKSGLSTGPTSASSPSSGSSSSSLAVTNLSGLILSNSSATSSPSLSQNNNNNDHFQPNNNIMDTTNSNLNPVPSTSNGITSSLNINLKNPLEQRIRALQIENRLLQDQLSERDKKISDLHKLGAFNLEDSIGRRMENVLERIESKIETSIGNLTNRVEALERKAQSMHLPSFPNGMVNDAETKTKDIHNCPQSSTSNDQFLELFESLKMEQQQESQKLLKILANILSHALQEINNNNNHTFH